MTKFNLKSFFIGILVATLLFSMVLTVSGESVAKEITAYYNSIKIYIDNERINPTDSNGNKVEPFIYNGTTYLPVRAVSEAFGKEVSWDGDTNSVYIGEQPVVEEETQVETESKIYEPGIYKVGVDIPTGLYEVESTGMMCYLEISDSASMDLDDIKANSIIDTTGYIRLKEGDGYLKIQDGKLEKFNETKNIKSSLSDGVYLVGYDLKPGTYKLEVTGSMGYVERLSDVTMGFEDIIANNIFEGSGYVEIKDSDFAVKLQDVNIELAE